MNLRELFIEWLTGSPYIAALERHHAEVRSDLESIIADKNKLITALRVELADVKADNDRMRLVLMPLGSPAGKMYAQKFSHQTKATEAVEFPLDWQGELNQMLKEEEDGLSKSGRQVIHEPPADDAA